MAVYYLKMTNSLLSESAYNTSGTEEIITEGARTKYIEILVDKNRKLEKLKSEALTEELRDYYQSQIEENNEKACEFGVGGNISAEETLIAIKKGYDIEASRRGKERFNDKFGGP